MVSSSLPSYNAKLQVLDHRRFMNDNSHFVEDKSRRVLNIKLLIDVMGGYAGFMFSLL
jgi:hypothetical protein